MRTRTSSAEPSTILTSTKPSDAVGGCDGSGAHAMAPSKSSATFG